MNHVSYPCQKCRKSMKWVDCPDNCGTGYVQIIRNGKMVGMQDCATCTTRGHRRRGGQLVCECGFKEVIKLEFDPCREWLIA